MSEQQALVVDDHPIIRDSIKQLLARAFPSLHIRDSSGTDGILEEICSYPWAFVTLDINLPGRNGLHIIRELQGCCARVPIIVFSLYSEEQYAPRALRAGAAAYLSRTLAVGVSRGRSVSPAGRKKTSESCGSDVV